MNLEAELWSRARKMVGTRSENHKRNSKMYQNALDEVNSSQITELNRDANATTRRSVIDAG